MVSGSPGGIGHNFVKKRWIDFAKPMEIKEVPPDPSIPIEKQRQIFRQFIPMLLSENPYLLGQGYEQKMAQLPEPYRTAVSTGKWDIFIGQAFRFDGEHHVIKPIPIPEGAPIYMTFDWGYAAPFAAYWAWIDGDGRIYVFDELYGWNGTENQGLRLTDTEIAEKIKQREESFGFKDGRRIIRIAGPDCFSRKPDYRGGGQGLSTAEVFLNEGLEFVPGDATRHLKIRQFHERLRIYPDQAPMLQIYNNCEHFIRTIPLLQFDPLNRDDIDTASEDHCYDSLVLLHMARPIWFIQTQVEKPKTRIEEHEEEIMRRRESPERDEYLM